MEICALKKQGKSAWAFSLFPKILFCKLVSGQAVHVQHPFQCGHICRNVQCVGLEQLVQLIFKGGHQQVHAALDVLFDIGDVFPLHILRRKAGVGVQQLEGGGQIVVHEFLQLSLFAGVLLCQLKDAGTDRFQTADLDGHHGVRDGIVDLPQLLQAATAAQGAFEEIKTAIAQKGEGSASKGRIVIATVKGDVHDIGKNIVRVILENYGFEVIDLGRDVPVETVVNTVREKDVHLVGLSALMTTTLKSMEETIRALHDAKLDCKIMVGGAVLTPEYAKKIGADWYAKDAKQSADIAKEFFGV